MTFPERERKNLPGGDVAKAEHGRAGGERPPRHDRKRRHPCDRDDRDRADHPRRGDQKGRLRCSPWQQRGRRGADPARGQGRHRRLADQDKHRMGDTMAYMFRDGKIDDSRIDASVSDLVAGRKSGRDNDDQLTYTCNVGLAFTTWRSPRASTSMPRKTASARSSSSGTSPSWCDRSKLDRYDLSLPTFWTGPLLAACPHFFAAEQQGRCTARDFCLYRGRFREYNGCR